MLSDVLHGLRERVLRSSAFRVDEPHDPVQVLEHHHRPASTSERFDNQLINLPDGRSKNLPTVRRLDILKVPLRNHGTGIRVPLRCHREQSALAEGGELQAQTITPKFGRFILAAAAEAQGLLELWPGHAGAIISDPDPGIRPVEYHVDVD